MAGTAPAKSSVLTVASRIAPPSEEQLMPEPTPVQGGLSFYDKTQPITATKTVSAEMFLPDTTDARCHAERYIDHTVRRYMTVRRDSRCEALRCAYHKAHKKCYPLLDGSDISHGHAVTYSALCRPRELALEFSGGFSLRSGCPQNERLCERNDDLHVVPFACPHKATIAPSGQYHVMCAGEALASGYYEVPDSLPNTEGGGLIRVPLYAESAIKESLDMQLPHSELVMHCRRKGKEIRVRSVELYSHLRACPRSLLDPRRIVPCEHKRPVLGSCTLMTNYASEDERCASEPVSRSAGLDMAIARCLEKRVEGGQFRFVAHAGRTQISNTGTDDPRLFYRLGACTEPISVITVLRNVQQNAPKGVRTIDMGDPELLRVMLRQSGAVNILAGLERAFAPFGSIPSLRQLINHTAGLPECFEADPDRVTQIFKESLGEGAPASAEDLERAIGDLIGTRVRPLYAPCTKFSLSYVGLAVLRYVLPDWRSIDSYPELIRTCNDLGMPSSAMAHERAGRHVCAGSDERMSPVFAFATGLSARIEEVAAFLSASAHGARHTWNDRAPSKDYAFVPAMLSPVATIQRASGTAYGYGWVHTSVLVRDRNYGKRGLRVLVRAGRSANNQHVLMCMVPSMSLSFALGTTAPYESLCGGLDKDESAPVSYAPIIEDLIYTCLTHMTDSENVRMKRATVFNQVLNEQLCALPAPCANYAGHIRYCARKHPCFVAPHQELERFCEAGPLVSLLGEEGTLLRITSERIADREGSNTSNKIVYAINEQCPNGERLSALLAYDPMAYRRSSDALKALANAREGHGPLDTTNAGMFRAVDPHDGLLGEHVDLVVLNSRSRDGLSVMAHPVVSYRGRLYVTKALLESIRREYAPRQNERFDELINARIARSANSSPSISELASIKHSAASQQQTVPNNQANIGIGAGGATALGLGAFALGAGVGALAYPRPYYAAPPYPYDYYGPVAPVVYPRYWGGVPRRFYGRGRRW